MLKLTWQNHQFISKNLEETTSHTVPWSNFIFRFMKGIKCLFSSTKIPHYCKITCSNLWNQIRKTNQKAHLAAARIYSIITIKLPIWSLGLLFFSISSGHLSHLSSLSLITGCPFWATLSTQAVAKAVVFSGGKLVKAHVRMLICPSFSNLLQFLLP